MKLFIFSLFNLLSMAAGLAQCSTTEDANNTVSTCKRNSNAISKSDSKISSETVKQAENRMNDIFKAIIEPSIKKTKGLRGLWSGTVNNAIDEGLTPYSLYSYLLELGCTKTGKLYEKEESGIVFTLNINSLNGFSQVCNHQEVVIINKSAEEKTVRDKINGRQMYLLNQPTESEKYAGFTYYRKEKDETKYFVLAKQGIPLFLPVSIKEVLLLCKKNYEARLRYENKANTDIINQSFESFLVDVDFKNFEKTFSKAEVEKAREDYRNMYENRIKETKKFINNTIYGQWIRTIDQYLEKTTAAALAAPCIVRNSVNLGTEPITGSLFSNNPSSGMQYVTLNPYYSNKKNPAMLQFVTIVTSINRFSAVTASQKTIFEDNLDFKKLESMLGQ